MPTNRPRASTAGPPWWLLLLAAAGIAAGIYLWQMDPVPRLPARSTPPSTTAPATAPADGPVDRVDAASEPLPAEPAAEAEVEPNEPKFPLPQAAAPADSAPLPAADDSDSPIL